LSRLFATAHFSPLQADLRGLRLLHVLRRLLLNALPVSAASSPLCGEISVTAALRLGEI
jgi:hypothetical protein